MCPVYQILLHLSTADILSSAYRTIHPIVHQLDNVLENAWGRRNI